MKVRCATCAHRPARGRWCDVGKRHATAQPKLCPRYKSAENVTVAHLRDAACELHRLGHQTAYAHVLDRAHREAAE